MATTNINDPSTPPTASSNNGRDPPTSSSTISSNNTNLKKLLADYGFLNITNDNRNPDLDPNFNQLLSNLTKTIETHGFKLPTTPASIMQPAFGKDSITDITNLYNKVYLPAIDKYQRDHLGDTDTVQLLRFFGLIQLVLFRSLSMVDMFSLLRSKYTYNKIDEVFVKLNTMLDRLENKGVEVGLIKEQVKNYRNTIKNIAPGVVKPIIVSGKGAVSVPAAASGEAQSGGHKKRGKKTATKSRKGKKSTKGKKSPKSKKSSKTRKSKSKKL